VCEYVCVCSRGGVCGCETEGVWKTYFKQTAIEVRGLKSMQLQILKRFWTKFDVTEIWLRLENTEMKRIHTNTNTI